MAVTLVIFISGCTTKGVSTIKYVCPDGTQANNSTLCQKENPKTNEIVCNKPYIRYGTSCCLDTNNNGICDVDEVTTNNSDNAKAPTISTNSSSYESSKDLSNSDIIEQSLSKVVVINVTQSGQTISQASGFLVSADGYVITNYHAVEPLIVYSKIGNSEPMYQLLITSRNGRLYKNNFPNVPNEQIKVIAYNMDYDIALLKINTTDQFNYFQFADSSSTRVGDTVYALGAPMGLEFSSSKGIISALNRPGLNRSTGELNNGINRYFQTDAAINPGNSGGPLIDTSGKVVGLNSFGYISLQGLKFALESNNISDFYYGSTQLCTKQSTYCIPGGKMNEQYCLLVNNCSKNSVNYSKDVLIYSFTPNYYYDVNSKKFTFSSFRVKIEDNPKYNINKVVNTICFDFKAIKNGFTDSEKQLDFNFSVGPGIIKNLDNPIPVQYTSENHADYYFEINAYNCETKTPYAQYYLRNWI